MDDTDILATSRQACLAKSQVLLDFCSCTGMEINASKTKLIIINGTDSDRATLRLGDVIVENCDDYT